MRMVLAVLLLAGTFFTPAAGAASPAVWFVPLDPLLRPEVGYGGSPEYMGLFTPDAPWKHAAQRVRVFKIYPQWIMGARDADLQQQFADLKRRGIALALEFGMMTTSGTCGRGVEGFGGEFVAKAAHRIQMNGGTLDYLAMDEPLFFGTLYTGPNACRWTPAQAAASAAPNLEALRSIFPRVQIGDIEPIGASDMAGMADHYRQGMEAFRHALGRPLAFFDADLDWNAISSLDGLKALQKLAAAEQVPFGVIYDGNPDDPSSAAWIHSAELHMAEAESAIEIPDQVIFQSWEREPKKLLPETASDSFTGLIDEYFRAPVALKASISGNSVAGTLTAASGEPIPDADISISVRRHFGAGMQTLTAEGTIPAGTTSICFGVRGNEGGFSGPVDIEFGNFHLVTNDWSLECDNASLNGSHPHPRANGSWLGDTPESVTAKPGEYVELNSAPMPAKGSDMAFTYSVSARIAPASEGSGYFGVFFLKNGHELSRTRIPFQPPLLPAGSVKTASDGTWSLTLPAPAPVEAIARCAGSERYRAAEIVAHAAGTSGRQAH
jgi:hypothetical protein